jgi:hypothetical protein
MGGSGWHPAFRHVDNGIEVSGRDRRCPRLSAGPCPGMPKWWLRKKCQGIDGRTQRGVLCLGAPRLNIGTEGLPSQEGPFNLATLFANPDRGG